MTRGDRELHLGRRHHIERAVAQRPHLGKPLAQLGARGTMPRPLAAGSQAAVVKIRTPRATAREITPRYLQHGKGLEQTDAPLYGPGSADPVQFHRTIQQDAHRFVLYVSVPAHDGFDRQQFIERFMGEVEQALDTSLAWYAADHYDTKDPHTHIVLRAQTDDGKALYMKKDFYKHGLRMLASRVLTRVLGRRREVEITQDWTQAMTQQQSILRERQHLSRRLDGQVLGADDPDLVVQRQRQGQQVYGHEGMAAHVPWLAERLRALEDQQRQMEQRRERERE